MSRDLSRLVLLAFALFLAYRFLAAVVTTLLLLAAALLLAVILSAPVEALHRRKLSRPAATALMVLGALAVLALGGYLLFPTLTDQVYQVVSNLPGALVQLLEQARQLAQSYGLQISGGSGGISASTLFGYARQLLGGALGAFGTAASLVTALLVITLVPVYLVAQPGPAVNWFARFFPPDRRNGVRALLSEVRSGLLDWLKGRLFSMLIVGTLATVALYLLNVPGALLLGILTGLLEFVPLIGPIVAAGPPVLLAFFFGGPLNALWVLLTYVGIQQVESNLIEPLVMQKAVSLHPAAVVAAVTVFGAAFGLLGTILAVPATVVATILVEELWFERLEDGDGEESVRDEGAER